MKIWKWQIITIFLFAAFFLISCEGENTRKVENGGLPKGHFEFSTDFTEDDWVLGDVPKEKMVPLKVVKQFSFRPADEEPTFDYLNVARHEDKLYVQNNYDGKINRIDMKTLELEENLYPQHADAIYEDAILHMTIDEKGRIILPGEKYLFLIDGEKMTKLQNTYMLNNFCLGYNDKIYAFNTRQQFSPGYEAFDLYDYQLNHLGSRFENPLWDDISGGLVASLISLSVNGDKLLLTSSCHSGLSLFNFTDGSKETIEIPELSVFKENQEHNYKKVQENLVTEKYQQTFRSGEIFENDIFLYTNKNRCIHILNIDSAGSIKKVYLIRVMCYPYVFQKMHVIRQGDNSLRVFLYLAGERRDGSRAFPVCVLEPAD